MIIRESINLSVSNPLIIPVGREVTESLLADLKTREVRAIYPLVKAINSGRLTKNYTFYPAESLIGKNKSDDPTGYASFVKPYGKPILREHQAQKVMGMLGPIEEADVPMGRIVYAGFRRFQEKKDAARTLPSKKHIPGTVEGDGTMFVVPAITDPEAITRVLGGAYHTVSIGSRVENVTESISNQNIAQLRRDGKELPPYERGQQYEGKLSYWKMGEVRGIEVSFVNVPSDEYAGVIDPDIGPEGIRLLVGEKKPGTKEFAFYDAKTSEKVDFGHDESCFDESHFVDSSRVGYDIWWLNKPTEKLAEKELAGTSVTESKEETDMNYKEYVEKSLDDLIALYPETKNSELVKEDLIKTHQYKGSFELAGLIDGSAASQVENTELFQKASDFALEVVGDWNEKAVELALCLYEREGGTLSLPEIDENTKVTLGELYGIEGDKSSLESGLTYKEWKALPDTAFVEGRNIPITNIESALYALQILPEGNSKNLAAIKAQEFGIVSLEGKSLICPLFIGEEFIKTTPFSIKYALEITPLLENVDTISKQYDLEGENKAQLVAFLEQCKNEDLFKQVEGAPLFDYNKQSVLPIKLGAEFLLNYFVKNELSDTRKHLATLVGLVRKLGIDKETVDSAQEAYKVFGTSVLTKFLENTPSKSVVIPSKEEVATTSVETIPDPVAATEQASDGKKESKVKPWYSAYSKPPRSSGKTVIKENK